MEAHFLLYVDNAIAQDNLILKIIGEAFKDYIFIETFSLNQKFSVFILIEQSLHLDVPLFDSCLFRSEKDIESGIGFWGHRDAVLVQKFEIFVCDKFPLHSRRHLSIIFEDNGKSYLFADSDFREFEYRCAFINIFLRFF